MLGFAFFSSLRMRLIALTSLILLVTSAFQAYFYPLRLRQIQRRQMDQHILGLATATASNIAVAIEFDDRKTAQEALEGLSQVSNFEYAVVFRANGEVMAQVKRGAAPSKPTTVGEHPVVKAGGGVLRVDQLVRGKGGGTGTLTLGLSMASLAAEEREQTHIGIWAALVISSFWAASATSSSAQS